LSVELHLPDLPEVPLSLGASPARARAMGWARVREALLGYLPLLLMLLLGLATWWLVKNTPLPLPPTEQRAVSNEPDYAMQGFALERYDANGRLKLRIEGAELRHYPATDRIEVDQARIRSVAADGRVTLAEARLARGTGDGTALQLLGGAEVRSERRDAPLLWMRSEVLEADFVTERVRTDREVQVLWGDHQVQARGGLDYSHGEGRLQLRGPLRAVVDPRGPRRR